MPIPLSRIIRSRLSELGLSVDELIARSDLARSTVYSFLNDTRNPQGSTFRKLAVGLDWSATELQAKLEGKPLVTAAVSDIRIARIVEMLPAVPSDRLDAIEQHVTLAVQPTHKDPTTRRRGVPTTSPQGPRRKRDAKPAKTAETSDQGGISTVYHRRPGAWASALSTLLRLLLPTNHGLTVETAR